MLPGPGDTALSPNAARRVWGSAAHGQQRGGWGGHVPALRSASRGAAGTHRPGKPSYSTTEGKGQPVPESWHWHPGCRHRPLANTFHAAGLGRSGGAAAESLPAPAGKAAALPAAGSFLLISCSLPACQRQHPAPARGCQLPSARPASAATEPGAEDGNRPWGPPCTCACATKENQKGAGVPQW